jgi:small-conductance mechanosensitive channel
MYEIDMLKSTPVMLLCLVLGLCLWPGVTRGQNNPSGTLAPAEPSQSEAELQTPQAVDIRPAARDDEIRERLQRILQATAWFQNPHVQVQEGVVFLDGSTRDEAYKLWAGKLAGNTQDVVAVVNRIALAQRSAWDFTPAFDKIRQLWRETIQALPLMGFGLMVLVLAWFLAKLSSRLVRRFLQRRIASPLLRDVVAKVASIPVFLLGVYIVLHVAGMTRLALTVIGSTGLAGLVIGIAFRDIMENFLASILISMQRPFRTHDLIDVDGHQGLVQSMTTRGTVLMAFDGNHIQIPNATIYKSTIRNYTANPNRREDFMVGIGYRDTISAAQACIMQVLTQHPAVLPTPEPSVLVEALGAATVNLRVFFWLDSRQHDYLKTRSSLIRMVKRALEDAGISMPDASREVLFPEGVPVHLIDRSGKGKRGEQSPPPGRQPVPARASAEPDPVSTAAEGNLTSEEHGLQEQARQARVPETGTNLLETYAPDQPRTDRQQ